jgi:hypothetical protein
MIVFRRFKGKCLCGTANIPVMTDAVQKDGIIWVDGYPICYETSENAHQHFARNDDGNGLERGRLTREIQRRLKNGKEKWGKVWEDPFCQKYKRKDHPDHWLWDHDFYNAPIEDLQYILHLIR